MTKQTAKAPGWRSAATRSRRSEAVEAIRAASGAWVDLPGFNGSDILFLRRDAAIEIELVATGDGRHTPRARLDTRRVETYRDLYSRWMQEVRKDGGFGLNREGMAAAERALNEFSEPRRVGR
jgi:hypothetical protein